MKPQKDHSVKLNLTDERGLIRRAHVINPSLKDGFRNCTCENSALAFETIIHDGPNSRIAIFPRTISPDADGLTNEVTAKLAGRCAVQHFSGLLGEISKLDEVMSR